jgi:hypothetical protein
MVIVDIDIFITNIFGFACKVSPNPWAGSDGIVEGLGGG